MNNLGRVEGYLYYSLRNLDLTNLNLDLTNLNLFVKKYRIFLKISTKINIQWARTIIRLDSIGLVIDSIELVIDSIELVMIFQQATLRSLYL